MSAIQFLHPERAHFLWTVLGLAVLLLWRELSGRESLLRALDRRMLDRLVRRPSTANLVLRLACMTATLALVVLALMRPQSLSESEVVESREAAAQIMVCLDVSRSMLAEDTAPNRLERAKAELRDLTRALEGHRLGLIAFAGRASVLCPLTPDRGFFRLVLDAAGTQSVTRGGTRIGDAIRKAQAGFSPGPGAKLILLVTDGEDHDSYPVDAAKEAARQGVRIVAIGFGDENGAEITLTDPKTGGRSALLDREGKPVRSRLDGAALREVALATQGAYVPAGVGVLDLESIVDAHIRPMIRDAAVLPTRSVRVERYQGFVLGALVCLGFAALAGAGIGAGVETQRAQSTQRKERVEGEA